MCVCYLEKSSRNLTPQGVACTRRSGYCAGTHQSRRRNEKRRVSNELEVGGGLVVL